MKKILGGIFFLVSVAPMAFGQINLSTNTINNYVSTICGPGITYSNVTLTGSTDAIASFTGGITGGLGAAMNSGIVLSTGSVNGPTLLHGPSSDFSSTSFGTAGVTELNTIAGSTTNDGVILEFDFVPITNMINVNFQFGSEEYLEYVNTGYNDAFAFFISGPGIVGSQNIALVPATSIPVTIDNINTTSYPGYFINNTGGANNNIMDGYTTMLTATRAVIPCSTYHIRLMIADGGDSSFDSWVFIQENGLYAAGNPPLTTTANYPFGTSTFEDCANASMQFSIPAVQATPYSFTVIWSGTATSGLDYSPLPTSITIPAGQTSVSVPINVLTDGITEGMETLICTYPYSVCSTATNTLYIQDSNPLSVNAGPDISICSGSSGTLTAVQSNAVGPIYYSWSNGASTASTTVNNTTTTTYTVTVTDGCGRTASDQVVVSVSNAPTSTFTVISPVCENENTTVTYTGTAGAGATYSWNFNGAQVVSGSGAGPYQVNWSSGGNYTISLTVNSPGCPPSTTTMPVTVNYNPIVDAGNPLTICEETQVTVTGATNPGVTGSWSHGIVEGVPFTPPVGNNWYYFTGTDNATGCAATDSVSIFVHANPNVDAGPDITTCQGTPITFNGSGALNYTWPSPIVNGSPITLAPGNYSIQMYGTDLNGCFDTSLVLVSVVPNPPAPVLNSNGPVCVGATLQLYSNVSSVVWSGPNGFSSSSQNPTIANASLAASGAYTAYNVLNGCTSATSTVNVVVNPIPAAPTLAQNGPLCVGATLNLTSNVATGNNWTGPNSFSSTTQNPNINPVSLASAGTYSNYVVALGCTSATSTVNVVVNPIPAAPVLAQNGPLCVGATLNLTSNVATGNNWTGPNSFSSTTQNPNINPVSLASAGTYSNYVVALGCTSATSTVNVVVNPIPAAPVLAQNGPLCVGATLNLTSNVATGNNWTGPNSFSSTNQNPNINPVALTNGGTYSNYVVALGCTSATSTVNVVVNPIPAAPVLAQNGPLCVGATLNLTSNVATGNNWTGPNSFSSTTQNPNINPVALTNGGTYSNYVVALGCTSATSTVNVVVNPIPAAPVLAQNGPLCVGATLNLTSNVASGNNWTGPNSFSSTNQNPNINPVSLASAGTYSNYVVALGCTSATSTVNVVVNPIPAAPVLAQNGPLCVGATLNLTSNVATGNNWTGPNSFSSTTQNPSINPVALTNGGTYSNYVVALGCTSATSTVNVVVNPIPAAPVLAQNGPLCVGATLNLTSNVATGNNWTGPNSFSSTTQNPNINPVSLASAGTYSNYVVALGCTSATSTVNVVVNPIPAAPVLAQNGPLCVGATLNLTSNVATGNNWTGPNSFSSTNQNPNINPVALTNGGTYSNYVVALGCTSATSTVNVVVNPIPTAPVLAQNGPLCVGATLNLTSNVATGNNWTGPNSFSSTTQNPNINPVSLASAGTYSNYVVALGCTSATSTVNVVVNPIPAAPVLAQNGPLCVGATLNLTSNVASGNNWTGPNSFSSTTQNPSINPVALTNGGTYSNYVVALGCTSATSTVNVVVNPIPAAPVLAQNGPLCVGATLNLTSNVATGNNWTGPNSFSSTTQNPNINPVALASAGTYSNYVVALGCTSATSTVNVVVNPIPAAPVLAQNGPLCVGATLNLTSNVTTGNNWTGPNSFSSTTQNPSINPVALTNGGTYSNYVVALGCTSATSTVNVVVNPIPAAPVLAQNGPLCVGATLNLTSDVASGNNWTGPNSFSSTTQNPSINPVALTNGGTYSNYVVALGCTSATSTVNVVVNPIPAAPVLAQNGPLCVGATLNLTSNVATGNNWTGPNSFSSTNQNPSINPVSLASAGTYSNYVVALGCTSATSTVNVVVNPIPAAPVLGENGPLCVGATLNLTSDVASGNNWTGPDNFVSSDQNPTINNVVLTNGGTYSNYVVALGCTSATSTVNVVVNPIPAAPVLAQNGPLCVGATLNLTSDVASGNNWTGPNSFSSTTQNPNINPVSLASAGTYSNYVVALGCTSATSTVNVVVNPIPAAPVLAQNGPLCVGATLNLTSDVASGNNWTGPDNFVSSDQNPTINNVVLANGGTYSNYVVALGCTSATSTVDLVVNPIPVAPVVANNGPICEGSTLEITSTTVAGAGYYWTGPNGFSSQTEDNSIPNAAVAYSGNYDLYIVVNNCTSSTVTSAVIVAPPPSAPHISSNSPVCEGNALELYSNPIPGANYQWSGPNGFVSNLEDPVIHPSALQNSGIYSLFLVVGICSSDIVTTEVQINPNSASSISHSMCAGETYNFAGNNYASTGIYQILMSNQYGCDSVITLNLTVNPNPVADFNSPVNVNLDNPWMTVYDNSYNAAQVEYHFQGQVIQSPDFDYQFTQDGTYFITQVVSNGNCIDSLTKEIFVNPYSSVYIPNSFTPNEDGLNESFKVIGSYVQDFEMLIFDRWGELIYKSNDIFEGWNGGFQNMSDKLMKQDTYIYKIKYKEFKGETKQIIGHVNLIR